MKEIASLIDKILLIGITIIDENDLPIKQIQVFGPILRVDADGIVISRNNTQIEFTIPPDFENVSEAKSGEYKLRSTGEVVIDPNYISSWTVCCVDLEKIEQYESVGFSSFVR